MNSNAFPNYTEIPNVIFDYWMFELSNDSFKLLMWLFRNINILQINEVSLNEVSSKTGLPLTKVINCFEELIKSELIYFQPKEVKYLVNISMEGNQNAR